MKKFIIILILGLTLSSCNDSTAPFTSGHFNEQQRKNVAERINQIETIGDTIIAYEEGNTLYYKTKKNQYYNAQITSGTDLVTINFFVYLITGVICIFIGIIFGMACQV